jgi:tetrahydromethanopterin S-methyltransferase subunit E
MTFDKLVSHFITSILKPVTGLIVALAVVFFLWALVKYIGLVGDPKGQDGARKTMTWGIIIIAVMISVWGLVNVLTGTFFGQWGATNNLPTIPQFKSS